MIKLPDVTLMGIDCIHLDMLVAAAEVSQKFIEFGSVRLLSSLDSPFEAVIRIDPITNIEQYSRFLMRESYKYISTKYMLLIQADGFIVNPFNWSQEYLNYDYIGATWWYNDDCNVGNGGFSLRSRRLMETVATDSHISEYHPEDFCICRTYGKYLRDKGFKFAPDHIAERFSVEGKVWTDQFGFHNTDISSWDIDKYADKVKHARYIDLFNKHVSKRG